MSALWPGVLLDVATATALLHIIQTPISKNPRRLTFVALHLLITAPTIIKEEGF
jgi:hypothetical protein